MHSDTLFRTVHLVDRVLSLSLPQSIALPKLQLLGAACLLIAAKTEEVIIPRMADIMYICGDVYSPAEIVAAERSILVMVGYDVGKYTVPMSFVRRIVAASGSSTTSSTTTTTTTAVSSRMRIEVTDVAVWAMTSYFCELTLFEDACVGVPASLLAAACVYVAHEILQREWTLAHVTAAGYTAQHIATTAHIISSILLKKNPRHDPHLSVVFEKYAADKESGGLYHGVSVYVEEFIKSVTR